jgi:hypothetical protein
MLRFLATSSSGITSIRSVESDARRSFPFLTAYKKLFMIFTNATDVRRFWEMTITFSPGTHKMSASTNTQMDQVLPKRRGVSAIT